jgi:hypothetical protein
MLIPAFFHTPLLPEIFHILKKIGTFVKIFKIYDRITTINR